MPEARYDDVPGHPLEHVDWRAVDLVRRALAESFPELYDVRVADRDPVVVAVLSALDRAGHLRPPGPEASRDRRDEEPTPDPRLSDLLAYVGAGPALVFVQTLPGEDPTLLDLTGEGYSDGDYAELDLTDREVVVVEALARLAHGRAAAIARKRGLS